MELKFLDVLFTVLFLVALVIPGYLLKKTKLVDEKAESVLSALVLYVAQPMLMITSFQKKEYSSELGINLLICAGITAVVHLIMIELVTVFIRGKEEKKNCVRTASCFANCGYMGFPFLQLLFGAENGEVLIYGAVVVAVFNMLNWSFGIYMISGDKKNINIKNVLLNPTIISIFIGFILFICFRVKLVDLAPEGSVLDDVLTKFMTSLNYLSEMVTPLAMMVIGLKLANMNIKQIFLDKWLYVACFNKLILMSLVTILCVAFLPISEVLKYTVFFTLSMPCATSTVLFAVKFGGDSESASIVVLLSTILAIATIPLMFLIFQNILYII